MKVKDVEHIVGITSANIRFYEKEGLITPHRNNENNYREYTKEDVERLRQIKFLRVLGVSVQDIKQLFEEVCTLDEILKKRQVEMEKESAHLRELQKICGELLENGTDLGHLDYTLIDEGSENVRNRVKDVLNEDTAQQEITQKQYNCFIWKWILAAFILDAAICFLFPTLITKILTLGKREIQLNIEIGLIGMIKQVKIIPILLIISITVAIATAWTAKMWALYIDYILAVLQFPLYVYLLKLIATQNFGAVHLEAAGFFTAAAIFILLFGFSLNKSVKVRTNCLYGILGAVVFSAIYAAIGYFTMEYWIFWSLFMLIFITYISYVWGSGSQYGIAYTKYSGILLAINMVNFVASFIGTQGNNTQSWRRDGKEFH